MNWNQVVRWAGIGVAIVGIGGCTSRSEPEEAIGRARQAITETHTINLPRGVEITQVALLASSALSVQDRVSVRDASGSPVIVASTGAGETTIGGGAVTGSVVSQGNITVYNGGLIEGDATTPGVVTLNAGARVAGQKREGTAVTPYHTVVLEVDWSSPSQGSLELNSPNGDVEQVSSLAPGRYTNVTLRPRNRLNLTSGNYIIDSFSIDRQSRLVIDDAAGPVTMDVRSSLQYSGAVERLGGGLPAFRLFFAGTSSFTLETAFTGTLIAPHASYRLATLPIGQAHRGAFIGATLQVSPDVSVVFAPFYRLEVTERWSLPSDTYGHLNSVLDAPDGATLIATEHSVLSRSSTGIISELTKAPGAPRFRFDTATGNWAYPSEQYLFHRGPTGTLLGQYELPTGGSRLVAGSGELAVFSADLTTKRDAVVYQTAEIKSATGSLVLPIQNPVAFAVGATSLVYSTGTRLVRVARSGAVMWNKDLPLRQLILSEDERYLLGMRNQPGSTVVHVELASGSVISEEVLAEPMRELHFSFNSDYSLAATRTGTTVFYLGTKLRHTALPLTYLTSSAVTDSGDLLVGGNLGGQGLLYYEGPSGLGAWSTVFGADENGYRPSVMVARRTGGFHAITKEGVFSYRTTRRF